MLDVNRSVDVEVTADFLPRKAHTFNCIVRLTNHTDIFDEMTACGCKLNLLTFGYYMEDK